MYYFVWLNSISIWNSLGDGLGIRVIMSNYSIVKNFSFIGIFLVF